MTAQAVLSQTSIDELRQIGDATELFFELVCSCDLTLFDQVFHPDARLFTVEGGKPAFRLAQEYRDILAKRPSPQALGAPREEQSIAIDFASQAQALVKARVRINQAALIDHLALLRFNEGWRIVSKTCHRIDL